MWHEINNILPRELIYLKVLSSEFMKHHWRSFPSDCFLFAESREKNLWIWSFESHAILLNIFVPSVLQALRISLATYAGSSFLPVFFNQCHTFFVSTTNFVRKVCLSALRFVKRPTHSEPVYLGFGFNFNFFLEARLSFGIQWNALETQHPIDL